MKKIGIIGAMEIEVSNLKADMSIARTLTKAGMEFCEGNLCGQDVVVVRSGIGKVNAAVCTQILVDEFGVDGVINTGIAGSLNEKIDIGDIVISTDLVHHDMDAVNFGYPLGQIPQMDVFSFAADENLAGKAKEVFEKLNSTNKVWRGRIVSGDQFVADNAVKTRIQEAFQALCTEMEGAAIAQAAYLNQVPFIVIRAISDKADGSATMDYPSFEKMAAENSVKLVEGLMEQLSC